MAAKAEGAIVPDSGTSSYDLALAVKVRSGQKRVHEKAERKKESWTKKR